MQRVRSRASSSTMIPLCCSGARGSLGAEREPPRMTEAWQRCSRGFCPMLTCPFQNQANASTLLDLHYFLP